MSTTDPSQTTPEENPSAPEVESEETGGPLGRELAFLEQRLSPLYPEDQAPPTRGIEFGPGESRGADEVEAPLSPNFRQHLINEYRRRQRPAADASFGVVTREAALAPPANNWIPIGPAVMRQGQASNRPAVSGRVAGIAVAPGGERVYVASANGGVWRSDDGGHTWYSTMEAWDLNPTTRSSDSLACGAIALDPTNPDRVFVGTGEGASGAYFGVGPIRTDDGGVNWITEPTASGSPPLAGSAFYGLAIDPANPERVAGATRQGLYLREPDGQGDFHWVRKMPEVFTSVVATHRDGVTIFYAGQRGGDVFQSSDGNTWRPAGLEFPQTNVWRIGLGVQENNPDVVYALVSRRDNYHLHGVYRLEVAEGIWYPIRGAPTDLFGSGGIGQGWYDLAIAVDPQDVNRIYLGGSTKLAGGQWSGSVYRCQVNQQIVEGKRSFSMTHQYIGSTVHADIHSLAFTPGESEKLWIGCDGGVFYTDNATGAARFESRNVGLSTLTMNHLAQHPTHEAVVYCGTQDNGTARYTGEKAWLHAAPGDGGFVVVHWDNPYKVLRTYIRGYIFRSTDGGQGYRSWQDAGIPLAHRNRALFYAPLAGTPPNPAAPAEADVVAFGGRRPWISTDFGNRWQSIPNGDHTDELPADILSLAFVSARRLYAGTTQGQVYRYDQVDGQWTRTQINTIGGDEKLLLAGPVTDIAIDPADPNGNSIYITFGGLGDYRRVWHFDGRRWQPRGGPSPESPLSLLDVQHNAIVVDPAHPQHLYAGADIGVWRSLDGGFTWETFSNGLPDAAVLDLKLHPVHRVLHAATHGRGVYERTLDTEEALPVELYLRCNQLDGGRPQLLIEGPDPTKPGRQVHPWDGPDIKVDIPSAMGTYQTPTNRINFFQFVDALTDGTGGLAVADMTRNPVTNRVYIQIHNRGILPAQNVRIMLLVSQAAAGLPPLPDGFDVHLREGTPISSPDWETVGIQTIHDVRVGYPQIAAFDLPSTMLPPPASPNGLPHYTLLALVHCPEDPFVNSQPHVDTLSTIERKAAHKSLQIVQFRESSTAETTQWAALNLHGLPARELVSDLVFELEGYPGRVRVLLPADLSLLDELEASLVGLRSVNTDDLNAWIEKQRAALDQYLEKKTFQPEWCKTMLEALDQVRNQPMLLVENTGTPARIRRIVLPVQARHTLLLAIDRPMGAGVGDTFEWCVYQHDVEKDRVLGGSNYQVQIVPAPDEEKELHLEIWGRRWWFFNFEVLYARLTAEDGTVLTPQDGVEVTAYFHTNQGLTKEHWPMQYHSLWRTFWMRVERRPHVAPGVVKVTVVAQAGTKEARRTAEIRF